MNQNNNNIKQEQYIAPSGQIQGAFNAPTDYVKKERRTDIVNLQAGLNPAVIFALVDLGNQMTSYMNEAPTLKRQLYIGFEHAHLKQLFYVDDTEKRSSTTYKECTFSLGDKSFLTQVINAVTPGANLDYNSRSQFDLSKLIGAKIGVNIIHKANKKDASIIYDNIGNVMTWNNNMPLPPEFVPSNPIWYFYIDKDPQGNVIGNNFKTENFANLSGFLKKKIIGSTEAQEYAARGGQFAKKPTNNNNNQGQAQQMQNGTQPINQVQQMQTPQQGQNIQQGNQQVVQQQLQQPINQVQQMQPPQQPIQTQPVQQQGWSPTNQGDDDLPF